MTASGTKKWISFFLVVALIFSLSACQVPSDLSDLPSDLPTLPSGDSGTTDSGDSSSTTTDESSDAIDTTTGTDGGSGSTGNADTTTGSAPIGTTTGAEGPADGTTSANKTSATTKNNSGNGGGNVVITKATTTTTRKITTTTTTVRTTKATQAGHKHSVKRTITQPPTCTEQGYTQVEYPCCGATEPKTNFKPALGHSYGEWHICKAPTNTATGEESRPCLRCPYEEKRTVAKLPMTTDQNKKAILDLVNVERKKAGLNPLSYYTAEDAAANQRVADIKTKFEHYRPDGKPFYSIMTGLGKTYFGCGENIAKGFDTPEKVMAAWMDSPGHRQNILTADFDALVVGVEDGYWVQLFISF